MANKSFPSFEEVEQVISSGSYEGWCINCGDWTHDSCEPDARKYECPVCEKHTCYGAEELLIMNYVNL
jgi:Zn finger protein HypA/HybF involved in hydrogenase expression